MLRKYVAQEMSQVGQQSSLLAQAYRIFCSVNKTCFRTLGSYLTNWSLLGSVRGFFFFT